MKIIIRTLTAEDKWENNILSLLIPLVPLLPSVLSHPFYFPSYCYPPPRIMQAALLSTVCSSADRQKNLLLFTCALLYHFTDIIIIIIIIMYAYNPISPHNGIATGNVLTLPLSLINDNLNSSLNYY
jgi:hypothetical protein